jgi:hypothetical protein
MLIEAQVVRSAAAKAPSRAEGHLIVICSPQPNHLLFPLHQLLLQIMDIRPTLLEADVGDEMIRNCFRMC